MLKTRHWAIIIFGAITMTALLTNTPLSELQIAYAGLGTLAGVDFVFARNRESKTDMNESISRLSREVTNKMEETAKS